MARKDEKIAGVYIIRDVDARMAYIGKSKGLGAIMRSIKSKLNARKFSNETLQEDWIKYEGEGFEFIKVPLPEGRDLREFHSYIRDVYVGEKDYSGEEMKYMLYNDISYIEKIDTIEISEISHLTQYERRFVKLVIDNVSKIDIDTFTETLNNL